MPIGNALPVAAFLEALAPARATVRIDNELKIPAHMALTGATLNAYPESGVRSNASNILWPGVSDPTLKRVTGSPFVISVMTTLALLDNLPDVASIVGRSPASERNASLQPFLMDSTSTILILGKFSKAALTSSAAALTAISEVSWP